MKKLKILIAMYFLSGCGYQANNASELKETSTQVQAVGYFCFQDSTSEWVRFPSLLIQELLR